MRVQLEAEYGLKAFDNYGLSELIGPGVSGECRGRAGLHIFEDHFYPEIIDPDTGEVLPEGEMGELVITNLTRRAQPVLRYRTRDITRLHREPCECGRTHARMERVTGRTDDMLIIRGVNVFPSQVEEALLRVEGTAPHYEIEVDRPGTNDVVTVRVEVRPQDFSDEMRQMQALHDRIDHEIQSVTGIRMKVELVKPRALDRFEGKSKRVVDRRREKGLI
jgi:phenylacetate-CoA ligase